MTDAAARAAAVLDELAASVFADLSGPPLDVEGVAGDVVGLFVEGVADLHLHPVAPPLPAGATLSGLLLPAHRRLLYDSTEAERSEGRRRFTIAHELGHWYLHREHDEQGRFCRSDEVGGDDRPGRPRIEREADRFAGALLMPAPPVRAAAAELRLNVGVMARRFGVSQPAMRVRLAQLNLLPPHMR